MRNLGIARFRGECCMQATNFQTLLTLICLCLHWQATHWVVRCWLRIARFDWKENHGEIQIGLETSSETDHHFKLPFSSSHGLVSWSFFPPKSIYPLTNKEILHFWPPTRTLYSRTRFSGLATFPRLALAMLCSKDTSFKLVTRCLCLGSHFSAPHVGKELLG